MTDGAEDATDVAYYKNQVAKFRNMLVRKTNIIKKLKDTNDKLERNSEIWRSMNVKLQQKFLNCRCSADNVSTIALIYVLTYNTPM